MKRVIPIALLAAAIGAPAWAAETGPKIDRKSAEAKCEKWAKDTGVAQAELKEYIRDCVREQVHPDKPAAGGDGDG